jgi:hypothetical protein
MSTRGVCPTEEVMNRADALVEDFMDFLFPDAPGANDPQA